MNIAVVSGREIFLRPDTSLENENRDIYPPDEISSLDAQPIVFARVSKAGKCVLPQFASRYIDSLGFGLLLFPGDYKNTPMENIFDHTTLLPHPLYNKIVFGTERDNRFVLRKNGRKVFETAVCECDYIASLEEAVCSLTAHTSIRIGDYVCVPVGERKALWTRPKAGGKIPRITGTFCDKFLFDFKILY